MVLTSLVLSKEEQMDYKDLTYPFAQKALGEQNNMRHALYYDCVRSDLEALEKDIEKYWPDYFSGNDLVYGAPLISHLLHHAGREDRSCHTEECIDFLVQRCGVSLNQPDENGYLPLDCITSKDYVENSEDIFNAAKYVLTHGGRALKRREAVIRFLEYKAGMTRKDFEEFESIGQCGKPKDLEREATLATNRVLEQQADNRQRRRQDLIELNETVKSKYASDYDREQREKVLKELTTTTPERQKKLEEIRDAYRQKPAYLQKPLETEKQRREKQFEREVAVKIARHKEPHRGGLLPSHGRMLIG